MPNTATFGGLVKSIREQQFGSRTSAALAARLTQPGLKKIEDSDHTYKPSMATIEKIVEGWGCASEFEKLIDLAGYNFPKKLQDDTNINVGDFTTVNVFPFDPLGDFSETVKYLPIDRTVSSSNKDKKGFGACMPTNDYSQVIPKNSIITISPRLKPMVGDYVLVYIDLLDRTSIFQNIRINKSLFMLKALSQENSIVLTRENSEGVKILGVILETIQILKN